MEKSLKTYEKTIQKKHRFGWTPKFEEEFRTNVSVKAFIPITEKTIEKLGWDLVYNDEKNVEVKRKESGFGLEKWTEGISIAFNHGKISVKSESLNGEFWDNGRNSKRVKLFIHAFKETETSFDKKSLEELEIEEDKKNNWDDYIIPENLPKPLKSKTPNFTIAIVGGIILSVLLGFILAELSVHGIYIFFLFEFGVGIAIAFSMKYIIAFSNFTQFEKLKYLLIGVIILTYVLNQYLQYEIILRENNYDRIGFLEFIKLRLKYGLTIKNLNTGWIGFIISWILQFVITYYVAMLKLFSIITSYQLRRVPIEVIDFAFYHLIKNKKEDDVRKELSLKGWNDEQNQNEIFEAIDAIYNVQEINRIN